MRSGNSNNFRKIKCAAVLTAAVFILPSCKGLELENKTEQVEEYTKEQAMVIISNERNRYENAYSEDIWKISVDDEGTGFDKLTIQNVKSYLEEIKLLCMLADERGISITSTERDIVRQMTDEYMAGLDEGDLEYIGCTRDDVQKMYTDIFQAEKLINSITGTVDSEISDSEAKVISIQQIVTADEKKAKAILKRIKIDGESFNSMASRYTEDEEIDLKLMRSDNDEDIITRTAFSLEENEVSNILFKDGLYYIIKCTDGYAEEDTLLRKARLEEAMNNKAVMDIIGPYRNEHNIQFVERFWNNMDFSEPDGSEADDFFDIYNEY